MSHADIDFVIIWVDGNDPAWQREKAKYHGDEIEEYNVANVRYRDWDFLRYWFRSIDRYAPWVRKIHFVTCGHVPQWLNLEHPKLHFVRHSDYMQQDYLPTFSANPIELNLHRIEGLAENFVFFNDDMFINAPVKPDDFFVNNTPCDCAILNTIKMERHGVPHIIVNDLCVLSEHFDFWTQFRKNRSKWLSFKYGKLLLRTLLLLPWRIYVGFYEMHTPYSLTKTTYEKVWKKERGLLDEVSKHKFRSDGDVNQWLMRYWQLAEGNFVPRSPRFGKMYFVDTDVDDVIADIHKHTHSMICINDTERLLDFKKTQSRIIKAFEEEYPEKTSFEKELLSHI